MNRYSDTPQAIALNPAHAFYATPLDRTLKGLLERWARDSHMVLAYENPYDYTLHRPVANLHSDDLHSALASLAALYAAEQLSIGVMGDRIVVRPATTAISAVAPADSGSAAK